jgi:hypothetical protein
MSKITKDQEQAIIDAILEIDSESRIGVVEMYGEEENFLENLKRILEERSLPAIENLDWVTVFDVNYGDGNKLIYVIYFKNIDLYVKLSGWYSSWDSSHLNDVEVVYPHVVHDVVYKGAPQTQHEFDVQTAEFVSKWTNLKRV